MLQRGSGPVRLFSTFSCATSVSYAVAPLSPNPSRPAGRKGSLTALFGRVFEPGGVQTALVVWAVVQAGRIRQERQMLLSFFLIFLTSLDLLIVLVFPYFFIRIR